jgi:hypothetical protein
VLETCEIEKHGTFGCRPRMGQYACKGGKPSAAAIENQMWVNEKLLVGERHGRVEYLACWQWPLGRRPRKKK